MLTTFLKKFWWVFIALPLVFLLGFVFWALTPLGPMPEAMVALESDSIVKVERDELLVFTPVKNEQRTGLIIYPGGRIDPRSYAPLARDIASQGYTVVIVPMPLNLAVFGFGRAAQVIDMHPDVKAWVIGGHSLGGSMAAKFTYENPTLIRGLLLWASYPSAQDDLSTIDLQASTIYATEDGLVQLGEIQNSLLRLPEGTSIVEIKGGNHAQFGWYGTQPGDNPASISREVQHDQILNASLEFISHIENLLINQNKSYTGWHIE